MSFVEKWQHDIWPVVHEKYWQVLAQRPAKQDTATGTHYGEKVYELLKKKKEIRNVACNLAYTDPTENTVLQTEISFSTVERFALDMFVNIAPGTDDKVAGSAASDIVVAEDGSGGRQAERILHGKKAWNIPARVPRGYEIPIAICSIDVEPEKGKFRRLGLDVAVNATWLAMKWALEDNNEAAEQALEKLMLAVRFSLFRRG